MTLAPDGRIMRIARPAQRTLRSQFARLADRYLRVATVNDVVADMAGYDDPNDRFIIGAFGWTACWRVLRRLRPTRRDVLLDIGCGSGRMVCAAARAGYGSVVGVEIAPEMAAIAQRNVADLRRPHADCTIVRADAATYPIPSDVTAIFLYNPFGAAILRDVLANIADSVAAAPRRVTIAYANPVHHDTVAAGKGVRPTGRIHLAWRPGAAWRRTQAVQFYEVGDDVAGA